VASRQRVKRDWIAGQGALKCIIEGRQKYSAPYSMESLLWFMLEAAAALAALIFIVWWTWPRGKRDDAPDKTPRNDQ
jgi:hypothetical protein